MIRFKRGDTFLLTCVYSIDGVPATLPDNIRSQLRDKDGNLIQELHVTTLADIGQYTLSATAEETATWPLMLAECDIQYGDSDPVSSTPTFVILIAKDITHD